VARFSYDAAIVERFPSIVGGVIHANGVSNGPTPPDLASAFAAEQAAVRARIGDMPLSEIPTLAAWRRVFRAFGVDPTQYRSAAEALLRRLVKQGALPAVGTLVDLANLVSIRYALPVAVFDDRAVSGGTLVRFARGDERWADLGASLTEHPETGEVVFVDDFGNLLTNIPARLVAAESSALQIAGVTLTNFVRTYGDARPGELVVLTSSTGDMEIAEVNGHAARRLGVERGSSVVIVLNN